MRYIIVILGFVFGVSLGGATPALAKSPKCGDVSRSDVRDIYGDAKDVSRYYDVRPDLDEICALLETFDAWESEQGRDIVSGRYYRARKKEIIVSVGNTIVAMKGPLTIMRVWLKAEPKSTDNKRIRVARIRDAKKSVKILQKRLMEKGADLRTLMDRY